MTQACACGTFAIGLCPECEAPVCGIHSIMLNDRRLCLDCKARADAAASRRHREAEQEQRAQEMAAARQPFRRELDSIAAAMACTPDPVEKFLIATLLAPRAYEPYGPLTWGDEPSLATKLAYEAADFLRTCLPAPKTDVYDAEAITTEMWSFIPVALMNWFELHPLVGPGTKVRLQEYQRGRLRTIGHVTGWFIGSEMSSGGHYTDSSSLVDNYILSNGTYTRVPHRKLPLPPTSFARWPLKRDHLRPIAELCQLEIP
jgi:hypothetical protein